MESLPGLPQPVSQVLVQPGHEIRGLPPALRAQLSEQRGSVGVAVLRSLEFEDAVAGLQLEVERQRAKQVLQRLIDVLLLAQLSQARLSCPLAPVFGHNGEVAS
jgi:hypothetical protein